MFPFYCCLHNLNRPLSDLELIGFSVKPEGSNLILNLKNNSKGVIKITQVAVSNTISPLDLVQHEIFPITLDIGKLKRISFGVPIPLIFHNNVQMVNSY